MASSPFIGLQVSLTLRSSPNQPLVAKILSINQHINILTLQDTAGRNLDIPRTDIAGIAALSHTPAQQPYPRTRDHASTPSLLFDHQPSRSPAAASPAPPTHKATPPPFVDPSILSFSEADHTPNVSATTTNNSGGNTLLSLPRIASQTPSSPASSSRRAPATATAAAAKHAKSDSSSSSTKKKLHPHHQHHIDSNTPSRSSSPAAVNNGNLDEDFDFGVALRQFDKKKVWDEICSSDYTDPATLLVSHNRIAGSPGPLARRHNGVGPANAFSTPQRGGQQKLKPNEMVLSSDEDESEDDEAGVDNGRNDDQAHAIELPVSSRNKARVAQQKQQQRHSTAVNTAARSTAAPVPKPAPAPVIASNINATPAKPSYAELEEKVRKLEAELTLAKRRNVLLEELAGLGLGGGSGSGGGLGASSALAAVAAASSPVADKPVFSDDPTEISSSIGGLSLDAASTPSPTAVLVAAPSSPPPAKAESTFGHILSAPLLTLFFPTSTSQHSALARIEAFYESSSSSSVYLSLDEAERQRICRNYQGFNFPVVEGVAAWLKAMWIAVRAEAEGGEEMWWEAECNSGEKELLSFLVDHDIITRTQGHPTVDAKTTDRSIHYVISTIASQAHSTLSHERLHALYFLSPSYRTLVSSQYSTIPPSILQTIEYDLSMRGYDKRVYQDEFQAYLAEGQGSEREFGNKCSVECKRISEVLRRDLERHWNEMGGEGGYERWEDVKWDVLKRHERREKDRRKIEKIAAAGGGTGKKKATSNKKNR